jgi:hypothetical protein
MRRQTKNEIILTVFIGVLIVIAGLSSAPQNIATYNGPTNQIYNYNISEVTSMNKTISIFTNNEETILDVLNTSDNDEPFTATSTGYYPGTFKNITKPSG